MIDPKLLRTEPDRLRAAQEARGESVALVDELIAADEARRASIAAFESLRAEQKSLGKDVARAKGDDKAALIVRTRELAAQVKAADAAANEAGARFDELMLALPNPVFPDVPRGGEDDFVVVSEHGTPRDFAAEGFTPRDHLELGELLGAIDMPRGAKVSGARFYFLTGQGAMLELALINLALSKAMEWGFTPILPPALVKPSAMEGTGFLGQAAQDVYHLPADDLYLVGTSEVALAAYHSDEILDAATLPGCTPATRPATGARRAATERTPRASSGCIGSTRSRCSSTATPTRRTPCTADCWISRKSSSPRSSCRSRC